MPAEPEEQRPRLERRVREFFESATDEVFVVCPHRELLDAAVAAADGATPPGLSLVTRRETANAVRASFPAATRLADLLESESASLRVVGEGVDLSDAVCLAPDRAVAVLVNLADGGGIETDDPDQVRALYEGCRSLWERAEEYDLTTPAYSRLLESMDEELIEGMGGDFASALSASSKTRGGESFDAVDVALLVGAKHECQFYRVSRWGEEVGVGSTSKFSKAKRRLENTGFLETVAVQRDTPGRPRERLRLTDRVRGLDAPELETALQAVDV